MQAHPAYKAVRPLDRNAVANAIGEKAGQLRESQFNCAHGVFLCDGGCELLFERASVERIVGKAFTDHPNLSFVVIAVVSDGGTRGGKRGELLHRLFINAGEFPLTADAQDYISQALKQIPLAVQPAHQASANLTFGPFEGMTHFGGVEMSVHSLKISSRVLLQVLAGVLPASAIFGESKQGDTHEQKVLRSRLEEGYTIRDVTIDRCPDEDDDWLTIEFDEDPAASGLKLE